jgi:anti-sigma regulatory factor (Ser/Thr protein kinase)
MKLPPHQSLRLSVSDESGIGAVRREASSWASASGFDATHVGQVALIATEISANVVRHAKEGDVILRRLNDGHSNGIEIMALDRGPGMRNVAQCLADGYSTLGTAGNGLGSLVRISTVFDIFSVPGRGSAVLCQLWGDGRPRPSGPVFGGVCLPIAGEEVCGDGYGCSSDDARATIAIIDGLGHGQGAADATLTALRIFYANGALEPSAVISRMHDAMRGTRGAAAAVVQIDRATRQLRFAGVGNCAGSIFDLAGQQRTQNLASHNGIVGASMQRLHQFTHACPERALLILHTDGLTTRWSLDDYPGLTQRHPSIVAGVLWRDFSRQRDDVTVLAFAPCSA